MKTLSITVSGKVQNVWFRKFTCDKAIELGLFGTVENLPNGNVFIQASGNDSQLQALENWCWEGSPESNVTGVDAAETTFTEFPDFRIIE